jgi:hypothetical protein
MLSIKDSKTKLLEFIGPQKVSCVGVRVKKDKLLYSKTKGLFVCKYPDGKNKTFVVNRETGGVSQIKRLDSR